MRHEQDSDSDEWKQFIETSILSPEEKEEEETEENLEIKIVENKFEKLAEVVSSNSVYWRTLGVVGCWIWKNQKTNG
jgi:predicted nucleotidyltransferase